MLKGFIIFFTATACPVSWSFAELLLSVNHPFSLPRRIAVCAHHTRPKAPMPTGWRSVYLPGYQRCCHSVGAEESMSAHRLVISKVVPKICARTNSAILPVFSSQSLQLNCSGVARGNRYRRCRRWRRDVVGGTC